MQALWNLGLDEKKNKKKTVRTGEAAVTMNQNYNHMARDQGFQVVK